MSLKLDSNTIDEILRNVEKLYNMSNTYMNNITGTHIEKNKLKILDSSIADDCNEIFGEIQTVHLQMAISFFLESKNTYINELKQIISEGTKYVIMYQTNNVKPKNYTQSQKFLKNYFEEPISEDVIVYFSAFYLEN